MALYFVGFEADSVRTVRRRPEALLAAWDSICLYDGAWLVDCALAAHQVRNALQPCLAEDEPAIVLELKSGSRWASEHVERPALDWLRSHVLN